MLSVESIYLAAIIQGLFQIAVLLLIHRGNRHTNRMLALLIGLLTMSLWNLYTYTVGLPAYWRLINFNSWYTGLFWGPTLYYYIGMLTGQMQFNGRNFLYHCLPGIVLFSMVNIALLMQYMEWMTQPHIDMVKNIKLLAFYILMSLYFQSSFQLLKTYRRKVRDNFASIDGMNLSWLNRLLIIFAVLVAVDMAIVVPAVFSDASKIPYFEILLFAEAAAIFAIGYFSLLHAESIFATTKSKYKNSPLDDQLSLDLAVKLRAIMQDSQPYRNNHLKLDDLAQLVGINSHYLSQIINEQYQKSFYDFVNEYRAKSAADLLLADENSSVTQVAYSAGFNNRASFNSEFKKHIGMTPSQYRLDRSVARESLQEKI